MTVQASNLQRHNPRHAAVAAGMPHQRYKQAVARVAKSIAVRRHLPRTQLDFYQQRLNQRR